jgi:hypothetical protein
MIQPMRLNNIERTTLIRIIDPIGINSREFSRSILISPGRLPNQLNSLGKYIRVKPVTTRIRPMMIIDLASMVCKGIRV